MLWNNGIVVLYQNPQRLPPRIKHDPDNRLPDDRSEGTDHSSARDAGRSGLVARYTIACGSDGQWNVRVGSCGAGSSRPDVVSCARDAVSHCSSRRGLPSGSFHSYERKRRNTTLPGLSEGKEQRRFEKALTADGAQKIILRCQVFGAMGEDL